MVLPSFAKVAVSALVAYYTLLPAALSLVRIGSIAEMAGRHTFAQRLLRYHFIIKVVVFPFALLAFVMGLIVKGTTQHFQQLHGVLLSATNIGSRSHRVSVNHVFDHIWDRCSNSQNRS
jgi:hypothetical protein